MRALPARAKSLCSSDELAEDAIYLSNDFPLFAPIWNPLSQNKTLKMYDVPEDNQPNINKLAILYKYLFRYIIILHNINK